jgi:apolipoprotein N-acyltransferase
MTVVEKIKINRFFIIAGIVISGACWYLANELSGNYGYLLWVAPVPVMMLAFRLSTKSSFLVAFLSIFAWQA